MAATSAAGDMHMDDRSSLRLFLAGDVMTGRGVDQILPHPGNPVLHEGYVKDARDYVRLAESANGPISRPVGFDYIWGDALAQWQAFRPDLRIINLETSVTTSDYYWQSKGIHYRMHPDNVPCLTVAKPDCCVLANNHVLDWGYAGLMETLTTLYRAGLSFAGAGASIDEAAQPARLSVSGKPDVLVHAAAAQDCGVPGTWAATKHCAGVNRLPDLGARAVERAAAAIAAERRDDDIVVVSIHWGGNWGYSVPPAQQRFARRLIDSAGVDVVFGHSSHHAKALECYEGKLIIYGAGDFVTDYEGIRGHEHYRPWLSSMYFVDLDPCSGRLQRVQIVPLRLRRFRLSAASAEDRRWLCDRLNESSQDFGTAFEAGSGSLVVKPALAPDKEAAMQTPTTLNECSIVTDDVKLEGFLEIPENARGIVVFAHGSGSSRFSRRNNAVAAFLREAGLGTLLFDLLTADEERVDQYTREHRFDIPLLSRRLEGAVRWLAVEPEAKGLPIGLFGSSTGAAAALIAAAALPELVAAVVSRGGRADLAGEMLPDVKAPSLLIVGGSDTEVLRLNRAAQEQMRCRSEVAVIQGATHLFEEPGALDEVAALTRDWFVTHLQRARAA